MIPIGEVAARAGLRPSALRYYEQVGLLPPAARISGRRHYDDSVLARLGVIAYAKAAGFTLAQIGDLVAGGGAGRRAKTERKLAEVESVISRAEARRALLRESLACDCTALDDCPSIPAC
jgi:MerR family redox-sensitive transcriptional activator SoxR